MTAPLLCLRISRRAVAAVALADEQLPFRDARHLRSRNQAAVEALRRYLELVLDQVRPKTVVIDCPLKDGSSTRTLLEAAQTVIARGGISSRVIDSSALCLAFGVTHAVTRLRMRSLVEPMFHELPEARSKAKGYMAEAAAAALFMESATALGTLP